MTNTHRSKRRRLQLVWQYLWPRSWWGRILSIATILFMALVIGPYLFSRLASPFRQTQVFATTGAVHPQPLPSPAHLRIATFNIAHGRGTVRSNWDGGDRKERLSRLNEIAALLRTVDADIVILNEVDFDASWSHHVNQAAYLAEKAGYPYRAEERNLDARVCVWTWKFGNAILSRYPINDARSIDLPSYAWWETSLAGKKRAVACDIETSLGEVKVIAAHLSHRSEALRVQSAKQLIEVSRSSEIPVIIAGDFNSTPPGFPLSVTAGGQNAMQVIEQSELFQRQPEQPPAEKHQLTFHSQDPNSIIDWILTPPTYEQDSCTTVHTNLSDHRLVKTTISALPLNQ